MKNVIKTIALLVIMPSLSSADGLTATKQPWSYTYTCPKGWHVKGFGSQGGRSADLVGRTKRTDLECEIDDSFLSSIKKIQTDAPTEGKITTDYIPFPKERWNNIYQNKESRWDSFLRGLGLAGAFNPNMSYDNPFFEALESDTSLPLALGDRWIKFGNHGVSSNSKGIQISGEKIQVSLVVKASNGCTPPDGVVTGEEYFDYMMETALHPTVKFGSYRKTFNTKCPDSLEADISKAYLPHLSVSNLRARCDLTDGNDSWVFGVLDVIADQNAGKKMAQRNFRKQLWIKISCADDYIPYKRRVRAKVALYEHSCFNHGDNYFIIGTSNRAVKKDNPRSVYRCVEGEQNSLDAGKG